MADFKVTLSADAWADLQDIGDEIRQHNPVRALTYVDEIIDACISLNTHPKRCVLTTQFGDGVRRLLFGEYGIFFRINGQAVQISRVLHGRRRIRSRMIP